MKDTLNVTEWLEAQVGPSIAAVIADAEAKAVETKNAIILAQRGRVNLQSRAVVSMISRMDNRVHTKWYLGYPLEKLRWLDE